MDLRVSIAAFLHPWCKKVAIDARRSIIATFPLRFVIHIFISGNNVTMYCVQTRNKLNNTVPLIRVEIAPTFGASFMSITPQFQQYFSLVTALLTDNENVYMLGFASQANTLAQIPLSSRTLKKCQECFLPSIFHEENSFPKNFNSSLQFENQWRQESPNSNFIVP